MLYHADLHIHTVLSPCGDIDMSPVNVIHFAKDRGLDIIGISDHNSTRQSPIIRDLGEKQGIFVLTGAEVTTAEEAHCLAFFPDEQRRLKFQAYLDHYLPAIPNNPEKFGYQVVADASDQILYEEEKLLISALSQTIEEVEKQVHELEGIFIPAHIDKPRFSILSQLGFIPRNLQFEALEISRHIHLGDFLSLHPELKGFPFIQSSDAHFPEEIGKVSTSLEMPGITFENIRKAIRQNLSPGYK